MVAGLILAQLGFFSQLLSSNESICGAAQVSAQQLPSSSSYFSKQHSAQHLKALKWVVEVSSSSAAFGLEFTMPSRLVPSLTGSVPTQTGFLYPSSKFLDAGAYLDGKANSWDDVSSLIREFGTADLKDGRLLQISSTKKTTHLHMHISLSLFFKPQKSMWPWNTEMNLILYPNVCSHSLNSISFWFEP